MTGETGGESAHRNYTSLQRLDFQLRVDGSVRLCHPCHPWSRQGSFCGTKFLGRRAGLRPLCIGDGFTYSDRGKPRYMEFFTCNMKLKDIEGAVVVALEHSNLARSSDPT